MAKDEAPKETAEQIYARKTVGWSRAAADAEPILDYVAAQYRIITAGDLEKSVWDILNELFKAKHAELDKELERSQGGQG